MQEHEAAKFNAALKDFKQAFAATRSKFLKMVLARAQRDARARALSRSTAQLQESHVLPIDNKESIESTFSPDEAQQVLGRTVLASLRIHVSEWLRHARAQFWEVAVPAYLPPSDIPSLENDVRARALPLPRRACLTRCWRRTRRPCWNRLPRSAAGPEGGGGAVLSAPCVCQWSIVAVSLPRMLEAARSHTLVGMRGTQRLPFDSPIYK